MKQKTVDEILLPYREGIPLHPSVVIGDKITHAVELMLKDNLKYIAVVRNQTPIGMLRLEDAIQMLGVRLPAKDQPLRERGFSSGRAKSGLDES